MLGGMYCNSAVARRDPAVFDELAYFGLVRKDFFQAVEPYAASEW